MDSPHLREYVFRNPNNFCLWNLQPGKILLMESGLLGFGIRNTAQGIRNPTDDWEAESKFHWQRLESSTWNLESTARIPESKTVLDSHTWGEWMEVNLKYVEFQNYAILKMTVRWLVSSFFVIIIIIIIIISSSSSSNNNMSIFFS